MSDLNPQIYFLISVNYYEDLYLSGGIISNCKKYRHLLCIHTCHLRQHIQIHKGINVILNLIINQTLHIAVDAKSNKVISFRITKGNVQDMKKFRPLVKEAAENFDIDKAYADKAHSSCLLAREFNCV